MFQTMDRMLPQLEALIATGNDVYRGRSGIPAVATLSRLAGLSPGDRDEPNTAAARTKAVKANKPASGKQSSRSSQPQ
jgi:hypothetical protein